MKHYKTNIGGNPRHIFKTIRLKRCRKLEAVNQEAPCESVFWKTSQNLLENIFDEDLFCIILPAI